jgi:hypothetical protein
VITLCVCVCVCVCRTDALQHSASAVSKAYRSAAAANEATGDGGARAFAKRSFEPVRQMEVRETLANPMLLCTPMCQQLSDATTLVGTCMSMCPPAEIHERELMQTLSKVCDMRVRACVCMLCVCARSHRRMHTLQFETDANGRAIADAVIKTYHRPAAADAIPRADETRPPGTCMSCCL